MYLLPVLHQYCYSACHLLVAASCRLVHYVNVTRLTTPRTRERGVETAGSDRLLLSDEIKAPVHSYLLYLRRLFVVGG